VSASTVAHGFEPQSVARVVAALRNEVVLVWIALGVVALHLLDDNFLLPNPGTSADDHLASGLVPLAILAVAAVLYTRVRPVLRAGLVMTLGAIAITFGVPAAYYLRHGGVSGDHYTGLLAIVAGATLIVAGLVTLWRARRSGGSRKRRYSRRVLIGAAALPLFAFVVFPVGFSYIYTHTGRTAVTPDLGVPYESVKVMTSDSLTLTASYVPSKNRAAVILFPGATRSDEARMVIRHGYGVLLLDPRGQGGSEGDTVRWAGDRDLLGGVEYLRSRPDVDPERIGGFGFSVGGEILIEAAAQSTGLKAIVSEGAGFRIGEGVARDEGLSGPAWLLWKPVSYVMTAAPAVFSNHAPPPHVVDRIGGIAPRSVLLIYADPGMGGEAARQPKYYAAAGEPKELWNVRGSAHAGGLDAQPVEYERRVVGFFDRSLLDATTPGTTPTHHTKESQ